MHLPTLHSAHIGFSLVGVVAVALGDTRTPVPKVDIPRLLLVAAGTQDTHIVPLQVVEEGIRPAAEVAGMAMQEGILLAWLVEC